MARPSEPSPYVEFDRAQWRELRKSTPLALTEEELTGLRGLGEQINLAEVAEVYLPLARLIHLQVAARQRLFEATGVKASVVSDFAAAERAGLINTESQDRVASDGREIGTLPSVVAPELRRPPSVLPSPPLRDLPRTGRANSDEGI